MNSWRDKDLEKRYCDIGVEFISEINVTFKSLSDWREEKKQFKNTLKMTIND